MTKLIFKISLNWILYHRYSIPSNKSVQVIEFIMLMTSQYYQNLQMNLRSFQTEKDYNEV